ncbi:unnamed protein product [Closterium sp. Naga37s-1]|nr:unnamed protein product [Closterium sp. Naga37s-1]
MPSFSTSRSHVPPSFTNRSTHLTPRPSRPYPFLAHRHCRLDLQPDPRRLQRVARMAAVCSLTHSRPYGACVPRLPCGMKAQPRGGQPCSAGRAARCTARWCALSAGARGFEKWRGSLQRTPRAARRSQHITISPSPIASLSPSCLTHLSRTPACNTPSHLHRRPRPVQPRHKRRAFQRAVASWCSATTSPARSTCCPPSSCHSPHSPRHHHSPPSSSRRSSRQPHVPAATLNAASPAAAPSPDHAAACVARLSSPAASAQQPVQSASAAASPASAELADHVRRECVCCVHINGMAWLADVSTPCCPASLVPHPMFLEPLLFQPTIHQARRSFPSPPISIHYTRPFIPCCDDAGVVPHIPMPPPYPPAPASAAPWVRGRGAGAVGMAPACTAESLEMPVAAVAAADRGREGWRAVERGVQGWQWST